MGSLVKAFGLFFSFARSECFSIHRIYDMLLELKKPRRYFTLNPHLTTVINSMFFKEKREGGTVSAEILFKSCVLLQISSACSNKVNLPDKHTWRKQCFCWWLGSGRSSAGLVTKPDSSRAVL